ncbi:MAG: substrate-binding domain-containing protein [Phycisphaerae bacterium]|nr:substrate-binding domain-containing protein [Phycisphaerae bacterium]
MAEAGQDASESPDLLSPQQAASLLRSRLRFYLPGSRLPGRVELSRQFGFTTYVARKAVEQLAAEGFVRLEGRGGAFVTPAAQQTVSVREVHVLASVARNQYFHQQEFLHGMEKACPSHGMILRVTELRGEIPDPQLPTRLSGRRDPCSTAWLLLEAVAADATLQAWRAQGLPLVLINWVSPVRLHVITTDSRQSIYLATERLAQLGHRHITYVGPVVAYSGVASRRRGGFDMAVLRYELAGYAAAADYPVRPNDDGRPREVLHRVLDAPNRPTAIVACDQLVGCQALAVCDELQLRVPDDVSVISGGIRRRFNAPQIDRLTCYDEGSPVELARMVVDFLASYYNHQQPVHLYQKVELIDRGSIGRPRGA